jgi:NAD(P)H-flavin reductase
MLIHKATIDPSQTVAMVCGPEIMMRFTGLELQKCGIPENSIYVSMERNMKCGIGNCGHCQLGGIFVCKDGPVFRYDSIKETFTRREA